MCFLRAQDLTGAEMDAIQQVENTSGYDSIQSWFQPIDDLLTDLSTRGEMTDWRSGIAALLSESAKTSAVAGGMVQAPSVMTSAILSLACGTRLSPQDKLSLHSFAPLLANHLQLIQTHTKSFEPWLRRVLQLLYAPAGRVAAS